MECLGPNLTMKEFLSDHVDSASETVMSYKKQYKLGKRTLLDLLNTENELFEARKGYLDAKYDEQYAKYRVMNATGNLLKAFRIEIPYEWTQEKITNMNHRLSLIIAVLFLAACSSNEQADYTSKSLSQYKDMALADDDKDGVVNARDLGQQTKQGTSIDNDGYENIPEKNSHNLHILFENDSSEVSPIYLSQIRSMADFLDKYPDTSVELQGFANHLGSHSHSLEPKNKEHLMSKRSWCVLEWILKEYQSLASGTQKPVTHKIVHKIESHRDVIGGKEGLDKEWTIFLNLNTS